MKKNNGVNPLLFTECKSCYPVNITDLQYDLADFDGDLELLKEAVNICARNNERRYSYFAGILKNWRANGVKHMLII